MQLLNEIIKDNSIERDYSKFTTIEHRKKFAQFFTPFPIADVMAKWLLGNESLKTVLEPAFGLGVFSRAILSYNQNVKINAFEVDQKIFDKAQLHFGEYENINLILQDYVYNDWENKYDGIICNPPYFKFHDYDNMKILKEIEAKLNFKLNGFTNLYTIFLLKSIYQLNANGRAAYIIPSEFLNSDYGKLVKSYLVKSKTLRHIIVVDFEENVFDDALTTASIILCANDNKTEKVQFSNVNSLKDLNKIQQIIDVYPSFLGDNQIVPFSQLNPEIKWRAYYQEQNSIRFKNLVPFSTFGKVVRGIATGANDYFTFNKSKAKEFSITVNYLLPCICKAIDVKQSFFTLNDFETLKKNDRPIFLFNAINNTDENVKGYILKGENEEIDKKYLTACRTPWYSLENRPPAPIWVSVFNRNGLKFIRNEANTSNLTTFHCIYPSQTNLFSTIDIDLLFAYLLTNVARKIFEDNSREYGNGLQKFEPNDINKAQMLDLQLLDKRTEERILDLYKDYRNSVLSGNAEEGYINQINEIFIEHYS